MAPAFEPPATTLIVLEAVGLGLAVLTAAAALRAHRVASARPLLLFALGFGTMAASQAFALWLEAQSLAAPDLVVSEGFDTFDVAFWGYYASLLVGLLLVFASFGRHPFRWAPAVAPVLTVAGPALQLAVVVVLFFIVLHAGLNHIARARRGSLQTTLGFFLVLVAHLLFLRDYLPLSPRTWLGEAVNVAGGLLLYLSLSRPRMT